MEEMKYNKIALILVFFIGFFILIYPPFVLSIFVPLILRASLFFIIVIFSIFTVYKKKYFTKQYLPFFIFFFISSFYWISVGAIFAEVIYFLFYFILAIVLLASVKRNKSLKNLLIDFYFFLVLILAILSIISFLGYNLELIPYELKPVGKDLDVYIYYHNYILGYINPKIFESGVIGRVCGFMFEPSYQGWFLSTNFFLMSKFIKKKGYLPFAQFIVLLGALSSFSTMSWIVFLIVFASMLGFKLMAIIGLKNRHANVLYASMLMISLFTVLTVVNQDQLLEALGPSSSDDRTNRADVSFLYLATASPLELVLGRGPGYIGKNSDRGESNPLIKCLVENGIISTIIVLTFIVYCTRKSKYFMIANLLWMNSVVVLFTPLFIVNVLICKWMDDDDEKNLNSVVNE